MRNLSPQQVELTAQESELLERITFEFDHTTTSEKMQASCDAAYPLAKSVLSRGAVPDIRLRYFTEPEFNTGRTTKSREQVFESNGTSGDDILRHAHFLPFLRYFLFGPNLPATAIKAFCDQVGTQPYVSSGDMAGLWTLARNLTRSHKLEPRRAAEEFYKLALECGMDSGYASLIRKNVLSVR